VPLHTFLRTLCATDPASAQHPSRRLARRLARGPAPATRSWPRPAGRSSRWAR